MKEFVLISVALCIVPIQGVVENLGCDPGWFDGGNGFCYYAETRKLVSQDNANTDCSNKNANLLRITSADEQTVVSTLPWSARFTNSDGFWTDLNDRRFDGTKTGTGSYNWGQYIPLNNGTITWEKYPTSAKLDLCGAVNIQGKMSNWQCGRKMGYICQMMITPNTQCPLGWLPSTDSCYLFSDTTDPKQLVDWGTAKQRCLAMTAPQGIQMKSMKLLTIDDAGDQNIIAGSISEAAGSTSVTFWTGLQKVAGTWKWYNGDVYTPSYITWAVEPDNLNSNENCAIMKPDFKFADMDCSQPFNYICRRAQNTDNTQYFWGCSGWTRAGHKCYTFYDQPITTWSDARSRCQKEGGDLLKVMSQDERHWVETQMMDDSHSLMYWTGLNDQAVEGTYRWADGQIYNQSFINWNQEPNSYRGNEDCAIITGLGVWDDRPCANQNQYICEYQNIAGSCPTTTGWYSNTDSGECYYVSALNDSKSWYEADNFCRKQLIYGLPKPLQASLMALNSQDELTYLTGVLKPLFQQQPWKGYWTDLNDRAVEGYWAYTDDINNPPNAGVIKWKGEPYDPTGNADCTYVSFAGRFMAINCKAKLGFICEKWPQGYSNAANKVGGFSGIFLIGILSLVLRF